MLTVIRKRLLLSGFVLCVSAPVLAGSTTKDMLMAKLFFGENHKREDIVQDALARLDMIAANDPDVMAARIRYLVRRGRIDDARSATQRLAERAPNSAALRSAQTSLMLATPEGRQQLQQARLLATSGHTAEALVTYRALFAGAFPSDALELEYWRVVANTPDGKAKAIERLEVLNRDHPGNNELRLTLAGLLFSVQRSAEGFQTLRPVAQSEQNRDNAADMWFTQIKDMPESANKLAALKGFVALFQTGRSADLARRMLATETAQWQDPAFRARMRGLQNVTANNVALAEPDLRRALTHSPHDGEVLGAMGIVESRKGQRARAVNLLSRAIRIEPNSSNRSKWESLLQSNRYWLFINTGDAALAAGQFAQAGLKYQQASKLDREDSYAPEGLGDVAMAQHDLAAAERFYKQALRLDKENSGVLRSLFRLYRARSTAEADAFAQHLSARQKRAIDNLVQSMHDDMLADEASGLENHNQWAQAARIQQQRLQADPNNPWTIYHLAKDLAGMGCVADADAVFSRAQRRTPQDATMLYAHALYLSSNDRNAEALTVLHSMPQSDWDSSMKDMAGRIALSRLLVRARALRERGHKKQAIALLEAQSPSDRIDLELADWAQQDADWKRAMFYEQRVLWRSPQNLEGRLGLAEILASEGQKLPAHRNVDIAQNQHEAEIRASLNLMRRVAYVRMVTGDREEARHLYVTLSQQAKSAPPGMDSALALRDAARFDAANHHPRDALALYQHDVVASGITPAVPHDNVAFTQMTRTMDHEDWLKRGIRSAAGDLYKQQNIMVTLNYDYWGLSGNKGYSRMRAGSTMLEADGPLSDGTAQLRADFVDMTAGTFGTDSDGGYTPLWATCPTAVCHGQTHQDAMGVSLAAGWFNRTWQGDIGTTPIGMKVVTIAGGGSYRGRMGPLGFILNVHHRPLTNSLLSFGGQRDPNTGKIWGGVRTTGVTWNLSYDTGGRNGVWASPSIDLLRGQNVENNWRARWMAGYYYKVINESNRRVTIGLSNMLWHYARDASGYTLGRGGYYSPQEYLSFPDHLPENSQPFELLVINICSLSWSDLQVTGLDKHPLWSHFDLLFKSFNSATSYSGPAAIRLLRASCGQPSHKALYSTANQECYLFSDLANLGFTSHLILDHNGMFGDFLHEVRQFGGMQAPLMSQQGLPVNVLGFDNSPIYDDSAVLQRWLQTEDQEKNPRTATFYNLLPLHDGNHFPGTRKTADYAQRARKLFDELDSFLTQLEQSHRRVMVVIVPEHGAALQGDKMQISGLRDIPSPAITNVPVGIKFTGMNAPYQGSPHIIAEPSSYLALSTLVSRVLDGQFFMSDTVDWAALTRDLPTTMAVSENADAVVIDYNGKPYVSIDKGDWVAYPQ